MDQPNPTASADLRDVSVRHASATRSQGTCDECGTRVDARGWCVWHVLNPLCPACAEKSYPVQAGWAAKLNQLLPDPSRDEAGYGLLPKTLAQNGCCGDCMGDPQTVWTPVARRGEYEVAVVDHAGTRGSHFCEDCTRARPTTVLRAVLDEWYESQGIPPRDLRPAPEPPVLTPDELAKREHDALTDRAIAMVLESFKERGRGGEVRAARMLLDAVRLYLTTQQPTNS